MFAVSYLARGVCVARLAHEEQVGIDAAHSKGASARQHPFLQLNMLH